MKAADIADEVVYEAIARNAAETGRSSLCWWKLSEAGTFPDKIALAKARQMIAKGRIRGCPCGCRGDLRFPWQEFGDRPDVTNWRERIADYLKAGKRVYGY